MPSLFSRSRRGSTASTMQPVDRNTVAAASAAAEAAFAQRRPSNASLSSAAAAAALRSRTSSPEPVGSIQTKRMIRRGSVSSVGSGSIIGGPSRGTLARGGLSRQNSGGSMTARTFRSPSPRARNGTVSPALYAPPVPTLPASIASKVRSSSLEPPQQRVTSPTPRGGRGVSVDRAGQAPRQATRKPKRLSNVNEGVEPLSQLSTSSRNSVNFSRPMASPPVSPISNKNIHGSGGYFAGSTGVTATSTQKGARMAGLAVVANASNTGQTIGNAANNVSSKKKIGQAAAPGSHLAQVASTPNGAGQRTVAANATSTETVMVYDANSRTFRPVAKAGEADVKSAEALAPVLPVAGPGSYDPATRSLVPLSKSEADAKNANSFGDEDDVLTPPPRNPARTSPSPSRPPGTPALKKHPSMVREDREAEEEAESASPIVATDANRVIQTSAGPAKAYVAPMKSHNRSTSLNIPARTSNRAIRGRVTSLSPQRSAHFSRSPVIEATKHEPPAREFSPAKSAMKPSPASSLRTASPMANFSPGVSKVPASDVSDSGSLYSQDGATLLVRKKKNRVSFDEEPLVNEVASTPKPTQPLSLDDDDESEMMKPRPALPSFGSVRKDKSPAMASNGTAVRPQNHESSSDQAVGRVLFEARNDEHDTNSRPVAPEVASKPPAAVVKDVDDTPSEAPSTKSSAAPVKDHSGSNARDFATDTVNRLFGGTQPPVAEDETVPAINLLPPTPGIDEQDKELGKKDESEDSKAPRPDSMSGIVVPGGWQDNSDEKSTATTKVSAAPPLNDDIATEHGANLKAIGEDSDDSGTFSDAAEDLSDLDEGGFASLNAIAVSPIVVTSPVDKVKPVNQKSPTSPPESPLAKQTVRAATLFHTQQNSGDWTEATAYWSRLSKQQRQQIERDHMSSDDEIGTAITTKPKKKKSASKQTDFLAASTGAALKPAGPKPLGMKKSLRGSVGSTAVAPTENTGDDEVRMRRSMRAASPGSGHMPTSMRSAASPQRKPQSAQAQSAGVLPNKSVRPASAIESTAAVERSSMRSTSPRVQQTAFSTVAAKNGPKQQRPAPMAPTDSYTGKVQRKYANDSDSESSFRKAKRKQNNASTMVVQNKPNMKRSMRSGSIDSTAPAYEPRPPSPTPASKGKGKTFSIRSLSPTGSLFGRRKQESIRETLRGGPVGNAPKRSTLRSDPPALKSRAAFSGSLRSAAASPPPARRFTSRFVDSDDEDHANDGKRARFSSSRFADSDDDDMPSSPAVMASDLRPVRGIPRKQGQNDGDSTDLEEEDDKAGRRKDSRKSSKQPQAIVPDPADVDKAMDAARRKLGISIPDSTSSTSQDTNQGFASAQGTVPDSPSMSNKPEPKSRLDDISLNGTPKKRGFVGSILRRNRASSQSVVQVNTNGHKQPELPSSPSLPPPSNSSPLVDQPQPQPPSSPVTPSSPTQAKLIRRNSIQQSSQPKPKPVRGNSWLSTLRAPSGLPSQSDIDSWPLPSPSPGATSDRPNTSTGITSASATHLNQPARPDLRQRSQSGTDVSGRIPSKRSVRINAGPGIDEESVFDGSVDGEGKHVYSERTGKKKRFPMLRRAFGLND